MELSRVKMLGYEIKKSFFADMHRMATGWAPGVLPRPKATAPESGLKFSLRSRQRLGWMGFLTRIGPVKG